jgi:hypothetical protein
MLDKKLLSKCEIEYLKYNESFYPRFDGYYLIDLKYITGRIETRKDRGSCESFRTVEDAKDFLEKYVEYIQNQKYNKIIKF